MSIEYRIDAVLAAALRSSFGVRAESLVIDDTAWGCKREQYANGAYLLSVNMAAHQCSAAEDVDVTLELWAYTDDDMEWFSDWCIQAPLDGHWPFGVTFCPFCGLDLRTLQERELIRVYDAPSLKGERSAPGEPEYHH